MLRWLAPAVAIALVLIFLLWPRRRRTWLVADPRIGIKPIGEPVVGNLHELITNYGEPRVGQKIRIRLRSKR